MIHLVTGGARAGKSQWAQSRTETLGPAGQALAFVATAQPLDDEMRARITRHQAERGPRWSTFEIPLDVPERIPRLAADHGAVLLDCLTLWTSNVLFADPDAPADVVDARVEARIADLVDALADARRAGGRVVIVTNEVGLGIVPFDALTRRYRDHLGRCNAAVARVADHATLLVSGLPLALK
jgi:adenosylcobinamide kinase/adenosylcobinamide-phosphate guanylyltransferase